jgi:D-serine deaminase-like pyridoxal phosphate-dependent protein
MTRLSAIVRELRKAGHRVPLVTGGGTGTFAADASLKVLNEVQPGSYIFMDNQYRDALGKDEDGAFQQSLFVQARVVSVNAEKWVTVDAGLKAFATDGPLPRVIDPRFRGDFLLWRRAWWLDASRRLKPHRPWRAV